MAKTMKDEDFSSHIRNGIKDYLKVAIELEKNRKQRRSWKKSERYNNELKSYFSNITFPYLVKLIQEKKIQKKVITLLKNNKDIESFLEDIPSSDILIHLSFARDEESQERVVQPNDLIDIAHLAGAVPYCDIVVMEKMFASICCKLKLDKKYGCMVLNSLKDLNKKTLISIYQIATISMTRIYPIIYKLFAKSL